MQGLILAIDVGNTNIHFGIFTDQRRLIAEERIPIERAEQFFHKWRKQVDSPLPHPEQTGQDPAWAKETNIVSSVRTALIASTRPQTEPVLMKWSQKVFGIKPLKANIDFKIPLTVKLDEPEKVGVDRLLNGLAASTRIKKSVIVIDFGTAITFDIISEKGEFLGGVIAPGTNLMARALHQDCAFLPLIKPAITDSAIGKNTRAAMQTGLYFGSIGLVNYILEKILVELKYSPYIIATGGDAELFKPVIPLIKEVVPTLTLEGLILAYLKAK